MPPTGSICYHGFITAISLWLLLLMLPYTASTHERHRTIWSRKCFPSLDQKNTTSWRRNMNSWCFKCWSPTPTVTTSSVLRGGGSRSGGSKGNIKSDDDDDELTNHRRGNRWRTSARQRTSLPQLLSSQHGQRKACSLYIWNAPSALLYRWCHHLQRDNIYEGLGGKKFVRIQPGSMLQLLYPCSRYSVDKCVLCGGTFRDHLTLWWSKNLYTPFDRYLDQVYRDSVTKTEIENIYINGKRLIKNESSAYHKDQQTEELGYHRQYVLDISALFDNIQKPREKANQLQRTIRQHYRSYSTVPQMSVNTMEQRRWPPYSKQSKIRYIIPRDSAVVDSMSSLVIRSNKSLFLSLTRDICLDAIDHLIDLQQRVEM